jgi:hypothetical protein
MYIDRPLSTVDVFDAGLSISSNKAGFEGFINFFIRLFKFILQQGTSVLSKNCKEKLSCKLIKSTPTIVKRKKQVSQRRKVHIYQWNGQMQEDR